MSEANLAKWHQHLKGELPGGLESIIDDDCVFYSPVVFTPQKGKALTLMYLSAAGNTFNDGAGGESDGSISSESKFRYAKEIVAGNQAVLEFESELDGKYVNGVDIITWNDEGKIIEFKVMIRPLQALNTMHQKMKAMLESMQ